MTGMSMDDLMVAPAALEGLQVLEMDEMYLSWKDICQVANWSGGLKTLTASSNGLECLVCSSEGPQKKPTLENFSLESTLPNTGFKTMEYCLTSLTLEYNNFNSLCRLSSLSDFKALEKLHLKGNQISTIGRTLTGQVIFGKNLRYVDISYNAVKYWDFVDDLSTTFPGLTALRLSHNPLYESNIQQGGTPIEVEDGYMLTLARLGNVKSLNFSNITPAERTNAEMFYLSRIGKEMAEVPEEDEKLVTSQHKRFDELCSIYGAPTVVRTSTKTTNPDFLEGRLINFTFYMKPILTTGPSGETVWIPERAKTKEIPRTVDIYKFKGIAAGLFGMSPLRLRLTWETGEWDPVAGYEEEDDDDSDGDGDMEVEPTDNERTKSKENGKWRKRDVTLVDSTRQIGFYIDGTEARVLIEVDAPRPPIENKGRMVTDMRHDVQSMME